MVHTINLAAAGSGPMLTGNSLGLARRSGLGLAAILLSVCLAPVASRAEEAFELEFALNQLSGKVSDGMMARNVNRVAVLEFIDEAGQEESLGANFGLLGKFCAEKLESSLTNRGGNFRVVDQRRLQTALKERQFTIGSLGSGEALKQLAESLDGLPVVAVGSITGRKGTQIALRCKLIDTATGDVLGRWDMPATLNDSEWAMLGRSAAIRRNERDPADDGGGPSTDPKFFAVLDKHAKETHPMIDPRFPYRVRMMIDGNERQGVFKGNEYFVPVRDGEIYELWVENKNNMKTLLRLLVDGLNTQSEFDRIDADGRSFDYTFKEVSAKRVSLAYARHWVLDPSRGQTVNAIRGFVTQTGPQMRVDRFKVVAAENSLAGRQQFTSDIGLITAAFYAPYEPPKVVRRRPSGGEMMAGAAPPGFGTGSGGIKLENAQAGDNTPIGRLICVLNIRYCSYDALPTAGR